MRKTILMSAVLATLLTANTMACQYTCPTGTYSVVNYNTTNVVNNYGGVVNFNSNSGSGYQVNASYDCNYEASYTEYDNSYCHLCGLTWDCCTCYDYDYTYQEEECDYGYTQCDYGSGDSYNVYCPNDNLYSYYYEESGVTMAHWANLRNASGNVIGYVGQGSSVEVIGQCEDNPSRTLIYDYTTGCYGTVASCYIWGSSDYIYENPTEWGCTAPVYDETTPWAADSYCGGGAYSECGYSECGYGDYSYTEECGSEYCADADYYISVDLEADTINLINNGVIILSGSCTCASGYSGQELCFSDQKCAGIWNTCSEGFYAQACEYMGNNSKVCCY